MNLNKKIKIGKMDRRITFQAFTTQRNDFGEQELIWADVLTTWAGIDYVGRQGASEDIEAERETAFNRVQFTIRQRDDFRPREKMRVQYDGFEYDITHIQEYAESRKRFWILTARKTDANDATKI